ncbi:O-antigen ligase family protein [Methyloversatilis universalis]|uniref:O-antigen ligase family protein n=1 Tax=Methyloversatilis universalis TaxID=378211 RepID=UPI0018DEE423|nr:O-antigen ligase family protein [Methyloversatilis universalis]
MFFVGASLLPIVPGDMHAHDQQRFAQWIVLLVSACVLRPKATGAMVYAICISLGATLWGAGAGRWGMLEALHLSGLGMLACLWGAQLSMRREALLLPAVVLPVLLYVLMLMPRIAALVFEELAFHVREFFPSFSNPRFFGYWVTLTLPVIASIERGEVLGDRAVWVRYVLGSIWFFFLLMSGTRGSLIALVCVALLSTCCGVQGRTLTGRLLKMACGGLVLYAMALCVLPQAATEGMAHSGAGRVLEGPQLSSRDQLWSLALEGIAIHPLLGNGPMMFAAAANRVASHPHNLMLQLAYEWGIPVALACMSMLALFLYRRARYASESCDLRPIAIVAGLAGGLIQAQLDGVLVMPFSQTYFVLLLAWLISIFSRDTNQGIPVKQSGRLAKTFCAVLFLNVCAQVVLSNPEWSDLSQWEQRTLRFYEMDVYQPRFWVQGVIPGADAGTSNR